MNKRKNKPADLSRKDNSPYIFQRDKIDFDLRIRPIKWTENQQAIVDQALKKETKMTLIDGIWGSGKTLLAVYCCLELLRQKKISNILYIRNAVQSGSGAIGWLPGVLESRLEPFMIPLRQKLDELLPHNEVERLFKSQIVECQPVALLRGTSYNAYGIILDEIGCMTKEDILLALSRVGEKSHVFGVGDSWQTDVKQSGFESLFQTFNDQESKDNGVFCYELKQEMDVMRSELLRFIMKKVRK